MSTGATYTERIPLICERAHVYAYVWMRVLANVRAFQMQSLIGGLAFWLSVGSSNDICHDHIAILLGLHCESSRAMLLSSRHWHIDVLLANAAKVTGCRGLWRTCWGRPSSFRPHLASLNCACWHLHRPNPRLRIRQLASARLLHKAFPQSHSAPRPHPPHTSEGIKAQNQCS